MLSTVIAIMNFLFLIGLIYLFVYLFYCSLSISVDKKDDRNIFEAERYEEINSIEEYKKRIYSLHDDIERTHKELDIYARLLLIKFSSSLSLIWGFFLVINNVFLVPKGISEAKNILGIIIGFIYIFVGSRLRRKDKIAGLVGIIFIGIIFNIFYILLYRYIILHYAEYTYVWDIIIFDIVIATSIGYNWDILR